ncbi:hypothetical protein I5677_14415 [Mobilitalea sibirica]|uniref:Uncharacterized protein n=1 Tax=Mobilitalea sibirica TaxID=1462919 RepID=A0A8J7H4V6_9FIRM|nr:hypothetical protein [Mobilitalea sibirica]MBH1942092.1 hypothetical protein [Mobilitalea sibirica]
MKRKITVLNIILISFILILSACSKSNEEKEYDNIVVGTDDLFELKLYVDKSTYAKDEIIFCYATLEYIGEGDSITIYSSDPLLGFGLKDDKYFDGGYIVNDVLITTTIYKGQTIKYDYAKSGGWSGDDPNAAFYEKFYSDKNLVLPTGKYEISAAISCSLEMEDSIGSQYSQSVSVFIEVMD